jgi:hypothetical protein
MKCMDKLPVRRTKTWERKIVTEILLLEKIKKIKNNNN